MTNKHYRDEVETLLIKNFVSVGHCITENVELDIVPENSKYHALTFAINKFKIVYRKGNVTPDRPGAFLAIWQRPTCDKSNNNKPIPLTSNELDYLFIHVESDSQQGMFIFPISLLIKQGIVSSSVKKGKTGFRIFPPWSEDRGVVGTKVFSESGKKTQRWQIPYFIEMDNEGNLDSGQLNNIFSF